MILASLALAAAAVPSPRPSPRDVVTRYYAAIAHRNYPSAYRLWDRQGTASGKTLATFTRGFARTQLVRARIGDSIDGEGAAGSLFVTVPVELWATLRDGTRQHFIGHYLLHRINDVPGSTAEQRRWHLASADLRPARP